jgi:hypothetical protein
MRTTYELTAPRLPNKRAYPTLSYRLFVIAAALCAGVLVHFGFTDYDQVMHGPPANAVLLIDLLSAPTMLITA